MGSKVENIKGGKIWRGVGLVIRILLLLSFPSSSIFPSLSVFSFLFHLFLPISLFPSPFIFSFLFGFFLPLLYWLVSQPFCINNPQNPLHYFLSFCSSLIRNKARRKNK